MAVDTTPCPSSPLDPLGRRDASKTIPLTTPRATAIDISLMHRPTAKPARDQRSALAKLIDAYNPGITMLVVLWIVAFAAREKLIQTGALAEMGDNALKSLLLVIPIMLAGWGVLAAVDRRFRLGLFR